jgi:hypothetical protein
LYQDNKKDILKASSGIGQTITITGSKMRGFNSFEILSLETRAQGHPAFLSQGSLRKCFSHSAI